jgi:hypothetical protein
MNNEFELITKHPTPEEALAILDTIIPGFRAAFESPKNLSRDDDGSFSLHGLCSELTSYVKDNLAALSKDSRQKLFNLVESWVKTDAHSPVGVSNAACTCFLENLAGEGPLSNLIYPYLGPESKKYFDQWNG